MRGLSLGLGLQAPAVAAEGGGGYSFTNAEAEALVARMSVEPDDTRKGLIDTLVGGLKTDGVWTRLDAIWVLAAHDEQAARLNWKSSTGDLTAPATPSFTTDVSYGGGSGEYFTTGIDVSNFTQFTQNDAHLMALSAAHTAKFYPIQADTDSMIYIDYYNDGLIFWKARSNSTTTFTASATLAPKMHGWVRTGTNAVKYFTDGVAALNTHTSAALGSFNPQIGATRPMKFASLGASLNDAQAAALYSRVNTYLAAIAP